MIKANLVLVRNILIVLLSVVIVNGADVVTLAIEHQLNENTLNEGQYVDGVLYVWAPSSDIDDPESFSFDGDSEIALELEEPGIYFFSAQTVLYNEDGTIENDSTESESIDYEVKEPTDTNTPDADRNAGDPDPGDSDHEDGNGGGPDPGGDSSVPVTAGVGDSSCGCFISSLT